MEQSDPQMTRKRQRWKASSAVAQTYVLLSVAGCSVPRSVFWSLPLISGTVTRTIGMIMFLFIAYNFFSYGLDVKRTGELTAGFKIPYYPFCFAISLSFLFQSLTVFCDLIKTLHGEKDE